MRILPAFLIGFLIGFLVIVVLFPVIIAYLIGVVLIFIWINVLAFFKLQKKNWPKEEYVKFGKYKIYR